MENAVEAGLQGGFEMEEDDREGLERERAQVILDVVYEGLAPEEVWRHFAALNAIPRPSKHEQRARAYVERVAQAAGASWKVDGAGNIVVYKTGVGQQAVAIQSHLDMVCERTPERTIDWERDPIMPQRQAGRISARGTTLGADNGIGAAMALALLSSVDLSHPPLELLFTVEEETGLQGASGLDGSLLSARWLLNLDTEEPDEIVIGCAGGRGVDLSLPIERVPQSGAGTTLELSVGGLAGGHSGIQIAEPLGNAIQILAGALKYLQEIGLDFRLVEMRGGNARNAIPRDASAILALEGSEVARFQDLVDARRDELQAQWQANEPSLSLYASRAQSTQAPLTPDSSRALVSLLSELPHGVLAWSQRWPGKVETSCNLATLSTSDTSASIHLSGRSFRESALDDWQDSVQVLGERHQASSTLSEGYPGWEPAAESEGESLLELGSRAFERVTGERAKIEIVHAGLECGIILSKRAGMEAISFGPLIRGAHTPEEWVDIATVEQSWKILLEVLRELGSLQA